MIIRPIYLKTLRKYRNIPLVKILAGIRRCGKSTILEMLKNDLMESGVSESNIISVRYTAETLNRSMTAQEMFNEIKSQIVPEYPMPLEAFQSLLNQISTSEVGK